MASLQAWFVILLFISQLLLAELVDDIHWWLFHEVVHLILRGPHRLISTLAHVLSILL